MYAPLSPGLVSCHAAIRLPTTQKRCLVQLVRMSGCSLAPVPSLSLAPSQCCCPHSSLPLWLVAPSPSWCCWSCLPHRPRVQSLFVPSRSRQPSAFWNGPQAAAPPQVTLGIGKYLTRGPAAGERILLSSANDDNELINVNVSKYITFENQLRC